MRLNKLAKKIFAAGLAVSLMMANAGVSFAANYTPITGTADKIKTSKEMTVTGSETVPATVTYKYAVTAKETYAGAEGNPTIADITFAAGETLTNGKATKDIVVDFSNVTYKEPGFYDYKVVETQEPAEVKGLTNNTETTKYIRVMVEDNEGTLVFSDKSFMYTIGEDGKETKSEKFDCAFKTGTLTFNKKVTGNQGSHDQYFKFTVTIPANSGAKIKVAGTYDKAPAENAATTYKAAEMAEANTIAEDTLVADETGTVTHDFYLQHGQSIVLSGIAAGVTYTVEEATAEGYTTKVKVDDGDETESQKAEGNVAETGSTAAFTNHKEGTIPTGVILDSAPFILIIGLAAAALIITAARKKVR